MNQLLGNSEVSVVIDIDLRDKNGAQLTLQWIQTLAEVAHITLADSAPVFLSTFDDCPRFFEAALIVTNYLGCYVDPTRFLEDLTYGLSSSLASEASQASRESHLRSQDRVA